MLVIIQNVCSYIVTTRENLGKVFDVTMNSMSNEDKWSVPAYERRACVNWLTEFHLQRRSLCACYASPEMNES